MGNETHYQSSDDLNPDDDYFRYPDRICFPSFGLEIEREIHTMRWGKKGIEMEQLILIVLALVLLFFILAWSGALGKDLGDLFNKLVDWF